MKRTSRVDVFKKKKNNNNCGTAFDLCDFECVTEFDLENEDEAAIGWIKSFKTAKEEEKQQSFVL